MALVLIASTLSTLRGIAQWLEILLGREKGKRLWGERQLPEEALWQERIFVCMCMLEAFFLLVVFVCCIYENISKNYKHSLSSVLFLPLGYEAGYSTPTPPKSEQL